MDKLKKILCLNFILLLITSCNLNERLSRIGGVPEMEKINHYEPETYPRENNNNAQNETAFVEEEHVKTANSLWRPGSRTFFRDQRARSVGDILKVVVEISDIAKVENKSETTRSGASNAGIPNVMGYESKVNRVLPGAVDLNNLINVNSNDSNTGEGEIERKEKIKTTIAATVVKILPSNNLVIRGSQQLRVDNELREILVEGIVRSEDITAHNSVTLDQIAEARVSYGGRGMISDYMQPKYGKQLLDIISPF